MALQSRLRELPRLLLLEALLTIVVLVTGVVPYLVFTQTPLSDPIGFGDLYVLPLGALGLLWLTLLGHAGVDLVRFLRHREAYDFDDRTVLLNVGFRVLETSGAILALVVPGIVLWNSHAPLPPGFPVALVFVLAASLVASGLVVWIHLGWLLWSKPVFQNHPTG